MNLLNTVYTLGNTEIERPCFHPRIRINNLVARSLFRPPPPPFFRSNFISTKILIKPVFSSREEIFADTELGRKEIQEPIK